MISMSPDDAFASHLAGELAQVSRQMLDRMQLASTPLVGEIGRHLFEAGGKRLRPRVALATAAVFEYGGRNHICVAAAVERNSLGRDHAPLSRWRQRSGGRACANRN